MTFELNKHSQVQNTLASNVALLIVGFSDRPFKHASAHSKCRKSLSIMLQLKVQKKPFNHASAHSECRKSLLSMLQLIQSAEKAF